MHWKQKGSNQNRVLWKSQASFLMHDDSYEDIVNAFNVGREKRSLFQLCANTVVVVQQFALSAFLLFRNRITVQKQILSTENERLVDLSSISLLIALLLSLYYSTNIGSSEQQDRKTKFVQRSSDALLLGLWLRLSAGILQSLTASYSSDTVEILALAGMVVHLLFCDYTYANGRCVTTTPPDNSPRPTFKGGTVSLNAALFSTTLLVSRLQSESYHTMCLSVALFAFYPATRHEISQHYPTNQSAATWLISSAACMSTIFLLPVLDETFVTYSFALCLLTLGFGLPLWKLVLQEKKTFVRGPWDIPSVSSLRLDYAVAQARGNKE